MKNAKSMAVLMLAVVTCPIAITVAQPVGGSVFTYQGRLHQAGQPFNGSAEAPQGVEKRGRESFSDHDLRRGDTFPRKRLPTPLMKRHKLLQVPLLDD